MRPSCRHVLNFLFLQNAELVDGERVTPGPSPGRYSITVRTWISIHCPPGSLYCCYTPMTFLPPSVSPFTLSCPAPLPRRLLFQKDGVDLVCKTGDLLFMTCVASQVPIPVAVNMGQWPTGESVLQWHLSVYVLCQRHNCQLYTKLAILGRIHAHL